MQRSSIRNFALLTALTILAAPSPAWADARTKARRAFREGMRLIAAKEYGPGIKALEQANEALPHPNVQYNIAQAYLSLNDRAGALEWLRRYLDQPSPPPDTEGVQRLIADLEAQLAEVQQASVTRPRADPVEVGPVPNLAQDDLQRLEALAQDLRPLSRARADELDAIADRLELAMRSGLAQPPPEAKNPVLTPPPPPRKVAPSPAPLDDSLRAVEAYQEQEVVTVATRNAASPRDAPAVVWVITQQQIRNRGYESVAEALRAVAGLHVIDDHVFIDVGVRGLHAGLRGMSRIVKVLIDGHPVAFRPTSGNLLGLEMIPIRAVDRIELIRGPGSALYGANAFLGIVQIVTRQGSDIRGGSVAGRLGFSTTAQGVDGTPRANPSGSFDTVIGAKEGDLSAIGAAQFSYMDRSGLQIPDTSPFGEELRAERGGVSSNDTARPVSLFGSMHYDMQTGGELTLQAGWQRLSARAEWLDFGALTHYSNVALSNAWVRLNYDLQVSRDAGLRVFTSFAQSEPLDGYQVRPLTGFTLRPNDERHLVESFQSQAVFSGLELRWDLEEQGIGVRVGTDLDVDAQKLASTSAVFDEQSGGNRPGDSISVASASVEARTFTNVGLYLQVSAHPFSMIDVVGGLRYDFQSLYGSSLNGRAGVVLRATESLYFKALYGSSFRAPAADQLYRSPAYVGDQIGCLDYAPCEAVDLQPQTAHTGELVAGLVLTEGLTAQVTAYLSFVNDLIISFPNNANAFVTTNAGQYLSKGVELESTFTLPSLVSGVDITGHAFFAFQDTASTIPQSLFSPAESIREEYREVSLFPTVSGGGGVDFAIIPAKLGLYLEGRYVGPRRASGSNLALSLGLSRYDGDNLPGYVELDANLSTRDLYLIASGETVISVRITDLIGAPHAEGGFRGWDIPSAGRLIFFRIIQEY